jgi:hypothetical protein
VLDLLILPVQQSSDGDGQKPMRGLFSTNAPRRCERMRAGDLLMALMTPVGDAALSTAHLDKLFENFSTTYFNTRGSTVSGIQAAANQLNEVIFRHNANLAPGGARVMLMLNVLVLRRDSLIASQAGAIHTHLVAQQGVQNFLDSQDAGRGLGLSQSVRMSISQTQVKEGDMLLLAPDFPASSPEQVLGGSRRMALEAVRRRMVSLVGPGAQGLLVQIRSGKGEVRLVSPVHEDVLTLAASASSHAANAQADSQPAPDQEKSASRGTLAREQAVEVSKEVEQRKTIQPPVSEAQPDRPHTTESGEKAGISEKIGPADEMAGKPAPESQAANPSSPPRKEKLSPEVRHQVASWWFKLQTAQARLGQGIKTLLGRMIPGPSNELPKLSPASMLLVAIAVPIMVAAVATTIYYRNGLSQQHNLRVKQAAVLVEQAMNEPDVTLRRNAWSQALYWLDQAEQFGRTEKSRSLRQQAQQAVDEIDGIVRLDFRQSVGAGFSNKINIMHIESSVSGLQEEVYLLDSSSGSILRIYRTGDAYEADTEFACGTSPIIGKMVDLATLPPNAPFNATVMGIDEMGNYQYCTPGEKPHSTQLIAPDLGWGAISAFVLHQSQLYVLDSKNNAVYVISPASDGLNFSANPPRLFFDREIPRMDDVIDLAVNGDDLFLLHNDGNMTKCSYRAFAGDLTECTDPFPYADLRMGRDIKPLKFPQSQFVEMQGTLPPDPSIYLLDLTGPTIHHFSMQLNLQRQIRPQPYGDTYLPRSAPTAFNISPARTLFLAYGNQLFHTELP